MQRSRSDASAMNDTTLWCQNASVTEPQRELSRLAVTEGLFCGTVEKLDWRRTDNPSASHSFGTSLYTREAKSCCHICGGRATTARGELFDEHLCSACEMPRGGLCKPPARPVVMTISRKPRDRRVVSKSLSGEEPRSERPPCLPFSQTAFVLIESLLIAGSLV